ncbi:MAG: hypothetical protein EZS28_038326 [Streblomastix strix]|uniref:Uncharacterized protein n=1 Tax=Streblomastix strix TaxID=222440 RepID=A0A5J4U6C6_9EUKA|nr:MAG: hypothetical protein EZS28_038326 [Streblomastix strix]
MDVKLNEDADIFNKNKMEVKFNGQPGNRDVEFAGTYINYTYVNSNSTDPETANKVSSKIDEVIVQHDSKIRRTPLFTDYTITDFKDKVQLADYFRNGQIEIINEDYAPPTIIKDSTLYRVKDGANNLIVFNFYIEQLDNNNVSTNLMLCWLPDEIVPQINKYFPSSCYITVPAQLYFDKRSSCQAKIDSDDKGLYIHQSDPVQDVNRGRVYYISGSYYV